MEQQFYLIVFGGLSLRGPDGSLESTSGRRRLILLATLAASGKRGAPRDVLGALFWPESDDVRARGALKQAIYALRAELGSDAIPTTSTGYALSAAHVGSDLYDFRAALESGDLDRAVAVYSGPFLAGVHADGAGELEQWNEKTRGELEAVYRNALLTLLTSDTGKPAEKRVEWAQRLLELDRGDARAAELLVHALTDAGRLGQAHRAADEYDRWVREELGAVPHGSVAAALGSPSGYLSSRESPEAIVGAPVPEMHTSADSVPKTQHSAAVTEVRPRRLPAPMLLVAFGVVVLGTTLVLNWGREAGAGRSETTRVMDLRHVAKHPVYLRVTSLGPDSILASAALVLRGALAAAIPRAPAFVAVFRAPEDSLRLVMLPGRDTMAATVDVTVQLSFVADSVTVFLQAENRANPAIASTATLHLGTRIDPLARLDDTVERLVGGLALRSDTDSLKTLVHQPPPRYESYRRWKAGFALFHGDWDPNRTLPLLLSAYELDSTWLAPVHYAVRVYDGIEEFNKTDSLLAKARRRLAALPDLRAAVDTLAQARARSRATIGSASLPPAEALLKSQPTATGAHFYERAREYYAAGRPAEAALLLAHIDSTGGVLSDTDGSSYWLRGLSLHSAGQHENEMALAKQRFDRSLSGVSHVEHFDYLRALSAAGRSSEVLTRFDNLPSDVVERDQYMAFAFQLGGEVTFHGDPVVARSLFARLSQACEQRERSLVHYRHVCALAHVAAGNTLAARAWVEELGREDIDPLTLLGLHGMVAAADGRSAEARATLEKIVAYRDNLRQGRSGLWRARILALLGDREGAIAALDDAKSSGWFPFWGMHGYFHFYPELASLEDDPRVRPYWIVDPPR